ncbi:hypothetical protein [Moorena sp. SIO3B2]|uniref:hypothetical protein n=1 Tax=Moorena sp. SIO3B2 TaxID=2607827 RepID=UPI0013C5AB96|nr:hypothetical protein [Moorena sp. SIO3B2]NEP36228.1 hypothetical protein [Moorena sp. SIO3B2]
MRNLSSYWHNIRLVRRIEQYRNAIGRRPRYANAFVIPGHGQDARSTKMPVPPRCPFHQDAHSTSLPTHDSL